MQDIDSKGMKRILMALFITLAFTLSTTNVQAQAATPTVDLQCDSQIFFDVYPGANTTSIMNCTLSNPTQYNETIEMTNSLSDDINTDGFYATFPDGDLINLTAGEEKAITVKIVALSEQVFAPHSIQINATVIEANGSTPPGNARSTNNGILQINPYQNYDVTPSIMYHQIDIISDDQIEQMIEISIENNGNSVERFRANMEGLQNELESYNMLLSIPVVTTSQVAPSETYLFNFTIGNNSEINTSTWLEFANGTKQVTIDTNITIGTVNGLQSGYYCYECNGSTYLRIQINLLPFETLTDADSSSDSVPGFDGHLSMVSIILAAFVIAQRNRY